MLTRIISLIMSILMTFLPFFGKQVRMDNETVANAVITAIENKDPSALEAVLCNSIKQEYVDKNGEVKKFIPCTESNSTVKEFLDCIEGDIIDIWWEPSTRYAANDGKGKSIQQNSQVYFITTTMNQFSIALGLETYNSYDHSEMGIRGMGMSNNLTYTNENGEISVSNYGEVVFKMFAKVVRVV